MNGKGKLHVLFELLCCGSFLFPNFLLINQFFCNILNLVAMKDMLLSEVADLQD